MQRGVADAAVGECLKRGGGPTIEGLGAGRILADRLDRFVECAQGFAEEFGCTPAGPAPAGGSLTIHCDTSLRRAMEDAAAAFEKSSGAKLTVHYQDSGTLIATIKLTRQGDLYLPADAWYLEQLAKDGSLVPMAADRSAAGPVAIGLLTFAQDRPLARDFMAFLAGKRGRAIFARHGYPVEKPG